MARGYPDFEGGKVALYSIADWAAKEGNAVIQTGLNNAAAFEDTASITYTVPSGYTFYLALISGSCLANDAIEGDSNQMCRLEINIGGTLYPYIGGNGGALAHYSPPVKVATGIQVTVRFRSLADHEVTLNSAILGYLIED